MSVNVYDDVLVSLGVEGLGYFKKWSGLSYEDFIQYMDKYDIWGVFDDPDMLGALMQGGIEEDVLVFGRGMPQEKQDSIIKNYYEKFTSSSRGIFEREQFCGPVDCHLVHEVVVHQLMTEHKMTLKEAVMTLYKSKTMAMLEELQMCFTSGIRFYQELLLELDNDSRRMK